MNQPVYNPGQPYLHQIEGGFYAGKIAHINGSFSPTATSLIFKFQTGYQGDPNDDVGLCIYSRLNEGILGINCFTKSQGWGAEQTFPNHHFQIGQPFEVAILCDPRCFKMAVNHQHLGEFAHRFDPALLTYLNVTSAVNDITLSCIWIESADPNPAYGASLPVHPVNQMPGGGPPTQAYPPYNGANQAYASPGLQAYNGASQSPNYQQGASGSGKSKGLIGMVGSAGAAIAGAMGASHLLGKKNKGFSGGYPGGSSGYPGGSSGYPGGSSGYSGGHSSGGGMMNKALGLGGGILGAKAMSKGLGGFGGSKALKMGLPLAGAGVGGYMLSKGLSRSFSFGSDCSDDGWGGGGGCGDWGGDCSD